METEEDAEEEDAEEEDAEEDIGKSVTPNKPSRNKKNQALPLRTMLFFKSPTIIRVYRQEGH